FPFLTLRTLRLHILSLHDALPISAENAEPYKKQIIASLQSMLETMQDYVKGYRFKADPVIKENIVTVSVEVEGNGDFLPKYAGNLDIITAAAVKTGEMIAESLLKGESVK